MADKTEPPNSQRQGLSDVQISELCVKNLFGKYTHRITLPIYPEDNSIPSVVILYGVNGVGKTTVLRMFDGLMRLDFDVFREVPFSECCLEFNTGQRLQVVRMKKGLQVTFDTHSVVLTRELGKKGALKSEDDEKVETFRRDFFREVENVSFNFIQANRAELFQRRQEDSEIDAVRGIIVKYHGRRLEENAPAPLADKVKKFISQAQLDSGAFFLTSEPNLFSTIIKDLSKEQLTPRPPHELQAIFEYVHNEDERLARFGLTRDRWDYEQVSSILAQHATADNMYALTVLSTYANHLTSRVQAQNLIAERLLTFEDVMNEFLHDKTVRVDADSGFVIYANRTPIKEYQLSTGEHQLLYLMVTALTTRRKGTVIAIDEPELSMHIAWQRNLLQNLIRCASNAAPQFILATHSPDISMKYSEDMIELSGTID
jgi:ABC-type cobalamin/Fe3+-siderophores transport system ATPase subunit